MKQMRDTSLEAYTALLDSGKMNRREQQVYQAIKDLGGKATNYRIATYLQWPINRITGRVRNLYEKDLITEGEKVKNPTTGRMNWEWKLLNN